MTAWSPAKIDAFKKQFYHFLNHVKINSKDRGPMILGEHLFEAQIRFYDAVFKSLGGDIHDIKHLKSRQLGISTASRALTLFWIGMHNGLKGYMILDTDPHKEEARLELIDMVDNLPKSLGFPGRDKQTGGSSNRNLLKLSNQSTLMFASAGIRASKTGGVLGRGSGVNFVHASEVCSWENTEGLESFRNSLSQEFENRLYLWESPLALDTPLLTVEGWSTIGEVKEGDFVFGEDGFPAEVIGLSPTFINRKCFEITFDTGEKIISDAVHKWQVERNGSSTSRWHTMVVKTEELDTIKDRIWLGEPIRTFKQHLPVDPYVVGVWLGDGHTYAARITCGDEDMEEMRYNLKEHGVECGPVTKFKGRGGGVFNLINNISKFRALNLIGNKHIPEVYLRSSMQDRLELLRGLMDTDGSIVTGGNCLFSNGSEALVRGICELLSLLGIRYKVSWIIPGIKKFSNGKSYACRPFAAVNFNPPEGMRVFSLRRKSIRQESGVKRKPRRSRVARIISIEECATVPVKCLTVDNPTHLFKVGRSLIPTHNTGRGYNDWYWMWNDSKADPHHQTAHFTGWWGKNNQRIKREDPDFLRYGVTPRSEEEHERIAEVEKLYGWRISDEQLAWWRRHIDPKSQDADNDKVYEASGLQLIEQPWTENDAFMAGNATFFDAKQLTDMASKNVSNKFKSYYYMAGSEFIHMRVTKAANLRSQMLKVWEEPDPDGVYVLGVDPAFGINEKNDCSVIQVFRCYADGCDQVAEYAWPLITTKQFAWVIAHLLGWYDNCYLVLELNGPGDSTWRELKDLKREIQRGIVSGTQMEDGFYNIFEHVKNFIYTRSDSMYAGKALQFKTTGPLKVTLMERFRDYVTNGMVTLKSTAAVEEMKSIQRDGDHIAAAGAGKDDRVLGAALAVYYWADKIKAQMSQMKRTRTNELAKRRLSVRDLSTMYTEYQIQGFFAAKRREKVKAHTAAARQKWRGR